MSVLTVAPGPRLSRVRGVDLSDRRVSDLRGAVASSLASGPVGPAPAARLRLTGRGRLLMVCLALVGTGVLGLFGGRALAAPAESEGLGVERHVVTAGETLWDIAASVTSGDGSVRRAVADLVRLNDLPSDQVMAGQTIVVPSR